jgi:hypothetical protein
MFKKALIIFFVVVVILSLTAFSFAQETSTAAAETTTEGTSTESVGLLPGNPFYFLKEWMRGIQRSLISDPIEQVEFELKVTTEKGEELKKVSELNRQEITEKAIQNYEEAMVNLKARFEELKSISNNPKINELLQKLAEQTEQHEQLFKDLSTKFEFLKGRFESIQSGWDSAIGPLLENVGSIEQVRVEITKMAERGVPGFGQLLQVMGEIGREVQAQPAEETATNTATNNEPVPPNVQINESIEGDPSGERTQKAGFYPTPSISTEKLNSIMLDIKKTFQIGQTQYAVQPTICEDVYIPVCGEDGKNYSNECYAIRANVNVAYEGACKE